MELSTEAKSGSGQTGWQRLNGNALKFLAACFMLVDHCGAVLLERKILNDPVIRSSPQFAAWMTADDILRFIGRLAFPIFCFLLVEGFVHTRDVRRYAIRLLIFGLISEIPFDLAVSGRWLWLDHQNVYFTLFFGLLAMVAMERWEYALWKQILAILVCCLAAWILKTDYDVFGVALIIFMYMYRQDFRQMAFWGVLLTSWEITGPLAFIPLSMYNGKRGSRNFKYAFYLFYPAHLLLLWAVGEIFL